MKKSTVIKQALLGVGIVLGLFFGLVLLDRIPLSAARPPKSLKTIEDFTFGKAETLKGEECSRVPV
jgi:hypothetical protein